MRSRIPPTEEDRPFANWRIQGEVQDENAWLLGGVAGHAGLFSNVPDLLRFASEILSCQSKKFPGRGKANLFDLKHCPTLCREARSGRQLACARLGHAIREFVVGAPLFPSFHRTSGLQRMLFMDRSRCWSRGCAAHESHLARPQEPADSRSAARFSRCRSRGPLAIRCLSDS